MKVGERCFVNGGVRHDHGDVQRNNERFFVKEEEEDMLWLTWSVARR